MLGNQPRHTLSPRVFGLNPNGDGYRTLRRARCFAMREFRQPPGIDDHQLFGFHDELLQRHFLLGRDRSLTVLFKQSVQTPLFGDGKIVKSRRNGFLHGLRPRSGSAAAHWTMRPYHHNLVCRDFPYRDQAWRADNNSMQAESEAPLMVRLSERIHLE